MSRFFGWVLPILMLTTFGVYGHAFVFTASIWFFSTEQTSDLKFTSIFRSNKVKFMHFLWAVSSDGFYQYMRPPSENQSYVKNFKFYYSTYFTLTIV